MDIDMKKKIQLSHFSNLIHLAHADNKIVSEEKSMLLSIGKAMGLSENEITEQIKQPVQKEFLIPEKAAERYNQLYDLLTLVFIDNEVHDKEIVVLKKYACKLGFCDMMVDKIVEKIHEYFKKGYSSNKISHTLPEMIAKI
jgi:hypothetical protein